MESRKVYTIFAPKFGKIGMESILITGASGFIGSFITEEAVRKGYAVWAGMRLSSSKRYLKDASIRFIELDYAHPEVLKEQLKAHVAAHGAFSQIVHCAGVTKCADKADFERVNYLHTRHFVEALQALDMVPKTFVYLSSLSIFGPIHEDTYAPITEADEPKPNTAYGVSKLKAERYLQGLTDFPFVILRPTGVYGPREKDYFLMAKSIKAHTDFSVGYKRQDITFVYVKDVVQAVFLAIEKSALRRSYFLSDGEVYQSRAFSDYIIQELGNPWVLRINSPLWVLKVVSVVAEAWAKLWHTTSTLNTDKYKIMKQRNWRCDITPAQQELGYKPQYQLERGVHETIAWYKEEGWL